MSKYEIKQTPLSITVPKVITDCGVASYDNSDATYGIIEAHTENKCAKWEIWPCPSQRHMRTLAKNLLKELATGKVKELKHRD